MGKSIVFYIIEEKSCEGALLACVLGDEAIEPKKGGVTWYYEFKMRFAKNMRYDLFHLKQGHKSAKLLCTNVGGRGLCGNCYAKQKQF